MGADWQDMNDRVRLDRTSCHYAGERAWFRCPVRVCGRRVAILYGGKVFAYRKCYDLASPSQREDASDRARGVAKNSAPGLDGMAEFLTKPAENRRGFTGEPTSDWFGR